MLSCSATVQRPRWKAQRRQRKSAQRVPPTSSCPPPARGLGRRWPCTGENPRCCTDTPRAGQAVLRSRRGREEDGHAQAIGPPDAGPASGGCTASRWLPAPVATRGEGLGVWRSEGGVGRGGGGVCCASGFGIS
eukprot:scaffold10530_cov96-Isochrysis_galbana.AAC.2